MKEKLCTSCKQTKLLNEFYQDKNSKDGYAWQCKECHSQKAKERYQKNKDIVKQKTKEYKNNHVEYYRDYGFNYRDEHKDELNSYFKERYIKYRPEIRVKQNQYRREHPEENICRRRKYRAQDNLRTLLMGRCRPGRGLPIVKWQELYNDLKPIYDIGKCELCGKILEMVDKKKRSDRPSIDRIIPELGYVHGNVAILCGECNRKKNNMSLDEMEHMVEWIESKIGEGQFKLA
jgi:hypothetical protein